MGAETDDGGRVHARPAGGAGEAGFLLGAPAGDGFPIGGGEEGEGVEHRPGAGIAAGQGLVDVGAPEGVGVFGGFQRVHWFGEQGGGLRAGADAPAFQDQHVDPREVPPVLRGQAVVGQFVEHRQRNRPAGTDAQQHVQQQRQIMRAGWPAGGEQRVDLGGQRLPAGLGEVEIVEGHGNHAAASVRQRAGTVWQRAGTERQPLR